MGGLNYGSIGGVPVQYGDICEAEIYDGDGQWKWVGCIFIETTDDGDLCFKLLNEEDPIGIRGDDCFFDYYSEVGELRYVCKPDDPRFFIGAGI